MGLLDDLLLLSLAVRSFGTLGPLLAFVRNSRSNISSLSAEVGLLDDLLSSLAVRSFGTLGPLLAFVRNSRSNRSALDDLLLFVDPLLREVPTEVDLLLFVPTSAN